MSTPNPPRKTLIPREGLCADVLLRLARATALNPLVVLPLLLAGRYTKRGEDLSVLYPAAARWLSRLSVLAVIRAVSNWLSDRVANNWVQDRYDWSREIVLVTGGAGGIGAGVVRLLDERGVKVVVLDVQDMSIEHSPNVHHFKVDLRSPEAVDNVAREIRATIGSPTVLVNNAGVVRGKTILDATPSDVRLTFDVNALSHYWIAHSFLPDLVKNNHGMVVTIASSGSWLPIPNMVDYCSSKAAALSFHEGLTAELKTRYAAPRVRTVCVTPGHTKTALFTGFDTGASFLLPSQEPDSISEAVVRQILTGRSGFVIVPEMYVLLSGLRMMPDWYGTRTRIKGEECMKNYSGRQVALTDLPADHKSAT